jgi:phosphatidylglycerophosphatase C
MASPLPTRIAIYDMDRTITRRGTMSGFLLHVLRRHRRWRAALLPLTGVTGLAYGMRLMDRRQLKAANLALVIGRRFDPAKLAALAESFADDVLRRNIYRPALDQIAADRAAGYRIVLATASFRLYVEAIAQRLGIDDVIATDLIPGRARLAGPNCYGGDKRALIEAWMAQQGIDPSAADIRAYSDHVSDTPMLEMAQAPVATTPSPALRTLARQRGWQVVDWKQG